MDSKITGVEVTEPADTSLDKTVRTDTKTIWCVMLEWSALDQWESQMHCAEVTERKESEYEEESEKSKTEMQITMGTDRKCTTFTEQDWGKLLHSILSSRNDQLRS